MSNTVLFGAQWGDEGKGKIIDVLTLDADWVVRYQGGNNAGHTVEIGNEKYVLHLTPSGILRDSCKCVIGNGLVVDIVGLKEELQELENRGISLEDRFFISDRAHIVFPYHKVIDGAKEKNRSKNDKIGTTKRGIGPAYSDKSDRIGLRMGDIFETDFYDKIEKITISKNVTLDLLSEEQINISTMISEIKEAVEYLRPFVCDTLVLLNKAIRNNDKILFEGAQGIMLDIDYGTYPFVTSSNTGTSGVASGAGIPPQKIDRVIGIIKAYTTRVGEGPFPTELLDHTGKHIASVGSEFGATTGRPRRCGWFDGIVANHAVNVGGINEWALMKIDVLDELDVIKVCIGYTINEKEIFSIPANINKFSLCKPVYKELPGWKTSTKDCKKWEDLPHETLNFINFIEELTQTKVSIVSVGPKRSSTIIR